MKKKIFLNFLLASAVSFAAHCQSFYHLHYNFHTSEDTTSYDGFLVRYNNGSGLLRVKYSTPLPDSQRVVEMDIEEKYLIDMTGTEDTNTLILSAANPRVIIGDSSTQFSPPAFLFIMTPTTGYYEPKAALQSQENPSMAPGTTFTASSVEPREMTKPFVLEFFNKGDMFFKNYFQPKTRGGFNLIGDEKKIKLYLLIVADVDNATIGPSCKLDMNVALAAFDSLTKYMGIKLVPKTIYDKNYSKQNVQKAIASLEPSPDDIVVFYYSGHGFRIPESPRRFPNLKLKNFRNERKDFKDSVVWIQKDRNDNITYSLNIEDIYDSIKVKGARFNLVVSDCCNEDIFAAPITTATKPGKPRGSITYSDNNVRDLFLNKDRMSILVTAASSGQRSASKNDFGGFFTYYFKTTMETFASNLKNNVNWDQICTDAKKQTIFKAKHTICDQSKPFTPEKICQQTPDYQILIEE